MDPIFWLGLSILLVAVSIAAVLIVAVPAIQELGRAARSVEKLFDTLQRELPPTLEALRLTGLEITELTDDMTEGVQNASKIAQNVDHSITGVKQQVQQAQATAQVTTRSVMAGFKAAWKTLKDEPAAPIGPPTQRLAARSAIETDQRQSVTEPPAPPATTAPAARSRVDPSHIPLEPTRRSLPAAADSDGQLGPARDDHRLSRAEQDA
jgi:uncharacterized protein YoxC